MKKLLSKNDTIIKLLCENPELIYRTNDNEDYYTQVTRAIFKYMNYISDKICDLKTVHIVIDNAIEAVFDIIGRNSELSKAYQFALANIIAENTTDNDICLYKISLLSSLNSIETNNNSIIYINGFSKKVLNDAYNELSKIKSNIGLFLGQLCSNDMTHKLYLIIGSIGSYADSEGYNCIKLILLPQTSFEKYRNKNKTDYLPAKSSFKFIKYRSCYEKYTVIGYYNCMNPAADNLLASVMLK